MSETAEVTRILADYVVHAQPADIPATVRHEASRALLNANEVIFIE